jgi:hypothetical protein
LKALVLFKFGCLKSPEYSLKWCILLAVRLLLIRSVGNFEKMEFLFGLRALLSDRLVDIVGKLPEEIGIMILR